MLRCSGRREDLLSPETESVPKWKMMRLFVPSLHDPGTTVDDRITLPNHRLTALRNMENQATFEISYIKSLNIPHEKLDRWYAVLSIDGNTSIAPYQLALNKAPAPFL
ncbi:hypothetical protein H0H92_001437, partial [Tricholoma furcatifolium]